MIVNSVDCLIVNSVGCLIVNSVACLIVNSVDCLTVNSVDCLIVNSVDCLVTLINCVANLAILRHFEDGKEMNKESLLILFRFRYRFQRSFFSPPAPIY